MRRFPIVFVAILGLGCEGNSSSWKNEEATPAFIEQEEEPTTSFTEEEANIIAEAVLAGEENLSSFNEEEMEAFLDALQEYQIYPDLEESEAAPPPSHSSTCSGYWGSYAYAETIEQRDTSSGLLYEVGSNCAMWAPGSDCGTDYDDYMLSFYFGWHDQNASTLKGMLKWTSTSGWVQGLLGNMSARLYEQTTGGSADNYNVYACVDNYFEPYFSTFKMRKY